MVGRVWVGLFILALPVAGLSFERTETREVCTQHDRLRRPYFGDSHVHTAYSFDASTQDTRNTPRDAYRFARGEPLGIQPYDENDQPTRTIQLDRPLDWSAITDHAELFGSVRVCMTPELDGYWHPICIAHRHLPSVSFKLLAGRTMVLKSRWGLCGDEGARCAEQRGVVWQEVQDAADEAYDRSAACRFTSFVGYEWTGTVGEGQNLHRNVIFRNEKVPTMPVSWVDTPSAVDLWDRLQAECVDGKPGCDAITIPHNSNLSGGLMFQSAGVRSPGDDGMAIGVAEAQRRSRWEPLVEMMQHKGDSECDTAAGWSDDEACGFEKLPYDRFGAKFSAFVSEELPGAGSFVRDALKQGLLVASKHGANPFKFGVVASTDTHIAAPGMTAEKGHPGHGGAGLGAGEGVPIGFPDDFEFNPGGLAVLWAEENSRDSLFSAMQRREAYATSGTRPIVRFFGGWDYPTDLCEQPDFVARGYAEGVAMGSDLAERPEGSGAPHLAVWAMKDGSVHGTALQRIQIVKGWLEGDEVKEQVMLVAGGDGSADVDLATCEPTGSGGATTLCSVWTDPEFDPTQPAFYYARVMENPTCRWSQYVCNAAKVDCTEPEAIPDGLVACCSEAHRPRIQERAWTSPIWYTPGRQAVH
ncbi:MAG: DUF3604 domain-containing protein [bacterium]|nr:DUF3604 domain-containing protein [bacterium]MCP5066099.1 DUF3604 domain-containing protein [bacterium]